MHKVSELYKAYLRGELFFESLNNLFGRTITSNEVVLTNEPSQHAASKGTPSGHPRIMRFNWTKHVSMLSGV